MSVKQGLKFDDAASAREIRPFIAFHKLDPADFLEPIESFKTFNEFFYRKIKDSVRLLDSPNDPRVVVSPADCRMMCFPSVQAATELWIKGQGFTIASLLQDKELAKDYESGSLAIFRLAPQDYHRFHIPVDGKLGEIRHIKGTYYTVNPMSVRSHISVYSENNRCVTTIDSPVFDKVVVVMVGATMVGSIVPTRKQGEEVKRREELGYFAFGGRSQSG